MSTDHTTAAGVEKTKLARRWLIKMALITLALIGFGGWAVYDLVYAYPNRGEAYAANRQLEYLRAAESARSLFEASIENPRERLQELQARTNPTQVEEAALTWLEALAVPGLGMLKPEHTVMESPRDTLLALEERFATEERPKALSAFDLPSQWLILFVCWGFALYLIVLWVRVAAKTYTWDAAHQQLGLPGGASLVPTDLADVDKRKWHKFFVTLEINDTHPKLAGQGVTLDLYRYVPLEEWVLEMERTRFPERAQAEQAEEAAANSEEDSGAASTGGDEGGGTDSESQAPTNPSSSS